MTGKINLPTTPPPELPEDEKSLGEALGMAKGVDLSSREQLNKFNELLRKDGVEWHINIVKVTGIWTVGLSAMAMFVTIAVHKIYPGIWLSTDQLSDLQNFLFSGSVGALVTSGVSFLRQK